MAVGVIGLTRAISFSAPELSEVIPHSKVDEAFGGVLLGTAVGDALVLPEEGVSRERIQRRWKGQWQYRFLFGRGMMSDDTEHTLMVAQALLAHPEDAAAFQRSLAWKFRGWFACLPGGVGLATAKACLKLWAGIPPERSAVVSGGSGPAMRSAIIGAFFADEPERRREFVNASSRLTHRSWQAETAASAVAEAAAIAVRARGLPDAFEAFSILRPFPAKKNGRNYSFFRVALIAGLEGGGDTDTVGAILGALAGASDGVEAIPREWRAGLAEWPRSPAFIEQLARRLAEQKAASQPLGPVPYFWPGIIPRNLLFILVVLIHGLRRLFP